MSFKIASVTFGLLTTIASAQPVQWKAADGGNGHWYEVVATGNISWTAARDLAAASYSEPSGGWRWVTDEPWQYTQLHAGEPIGVAPQ
jgi:hypothetical protein